MHKYIAATNCKRDPLTSVNLSRSMPIVLAISAECKYALAVLTCPLEVTVRNWTSPLQSNYQFYNRAPTPSFLLAIYEYPSHVIIDPLPSLYGGTGDSVVKGLNVALFPGTFWRWKHGSTYYFSGY